MVPAACFDMILCQRQAYRNRDRQHLKALHLKAIDGPDYALEGP